MMIVADKKTERARAGSFVFPGTPEEGMPAAPFPRREAESDGEIG